MACFTDVDRPKRFVAVELWAGPPPFSWLWALRAIRR